MDKLTISNLSLFYGQSQALHDISLAIPGRQIMAFIGPSGCGKTTLLKLINGLVVPTKGEVFVAGERLSDCDLTALRRKIGYAVQGAKLFPHLTVEDNICYVPCLERKMTKEEKQALTEKMLAMTELSPELASRFPSQLSGGQKQRVGIARAMAAQPDILLMDEPFGAVDEITRRTLQEELSVLQKKTGITIVFITHDIEEAFNLGSRILIMKDGVIWQEGKKEELLHAPRDGFVRQLIGGM